MKFGLQTLDAEYLVHRVWICSTFPSVIQPAILFIHADGTTVDIMLLYVATRSGGVEKIAEPSRLTAKIVNSMDKLRNGSNSSYPMTQVSLEALARRYCPVPAANPSTLARDGQLEEQCRG